MRQPMICSTSSKKRWLPVSWPRCRASRISESSCSGTPCSTKRGIACTPIGFVDCQVQVRRIQIDPTSLLADTLPVTGPGEVTGYWHHPRTYGVELDVRRTGEQVRLRLHRAGLITAFPLGARTPLDAIAIPRRTGR